LKGQEIIIKKYCATYFCKKKKMEKNNKNYVLEMEKSGLWTDILYVRNVLTHHASS
jgi:hypothetical protein